MLLRFAIVMLMAMPARAANYADMFGGSPAAAQKSNDYAGIFSVPDRPDRTLASPERDEPFGQFFEAPAAKPDVTPHRIAVVLTTPNCPPCVKIKTDCGDLNLANAVEFFDINSKAGKRLSALYGPFDGAPAVVLFRDDKWVRSIKANARAKDIAAWVRDGKLSVQTPVKSQPVAVAYGQTTYTTGPDYSSSFGYQRQTTGPQWYLHGGSNAASLRDHLHREHGYTRESLARLDLQSLRNLHSDAHNGHRGPVTTSRWRVTRTTYRSRPSFVGRVLASPVTVPLAIIRSICPTCR